MPLQSKLSSKKTSPAPGERRAGKRPGDRPASNRGDACGGHNVLESRLQRSLFRLYCERQRLRHSSPGMLRLAVLADEVIRRDTQGKAKGKKTRRGRSACPWRTNSSTTEHSEKHGNNQDLESPSFDLRVGVAAEVDQQSKFHPGCLQVVQYLGLVLGAIAFTAFICPSLD